MKIYADLHIHSLLSRATSRKMTIAEITRYSRIKGLNMVGTGDALHPTWMKELKRELADLPGTNLYRPKRHGEGIYFVTQAEVATIHRYEGKARRIHHVILMPSFEVAEQLNKALSAHGDLRADGRPTLNITPAELVEITMGIDSRNFVFPAHAWTSRREAILDQKPWWSIFGAIGGVDTMEECYGDQTRHIHALETGLIDSLE